MARFHIGFPVDAREGTPSYGVLVFAHSGDGASHQVVGGQRSDSCMKGSGADFVSTQIEPDRWKRFLFDPYPGELFEQYASITKTPKEKLSPDALATGQSDGAACALVWGGGVERSDLADNDSIVFVSCKVAHKGIKGLRGLYLERVADDSASGSQSLCHKWEVVEASWKFWRTALVLHEDDVRILAGYLDVSRFQRRELADLANLKEACLEEKPWLISVKANELPDLAEALGLPRHRFNPKLRFALPPLDFTERFKEAAEGFVGREWLRRDVEAWLDDPDGSQVLVIEGEPGTGKTAIIGWMADWLGEKVAALYGCGESTIPLGQHQDPKDGFAFVDSIVQQLYDQLPGYRSRVLALEKGPEIRRDTVQQHVGDVLSVPLKELLASDCQRVLLFDALDEGNTGQDDAWSAIKNLMKCLPKWIRLVVSSCPGENVEEIKSGYINHVALRGTDSTQSKDIDLYFATILNELRGPERERFQQFIMKNKDFVKGNFLFATTIFKEVINLTTIKTHVAIDRYTGTAKEGSLHNVVCVKAGTKLKAVVVFRSPPTAEEVALLYFAASAVNQLGSGISRGNGNCRIDLLDIPKDWAEWLEDIRSGGAHTMPSVSNISSLKLRITFISEFMLSNTASLDFINDVIPGSALKGALRRAAESLLVQLNHLYGTDWQLACNNVFGVVFGNECWASKIAIGSARFEALLEDVISSSDITDFYHKRFIRIFEEEPFSWRSLKPALEVLCATFGLLPEALLIAAAELSNKEWKKGYEILAPFVRKNHNNETGDIVYELVHPYLKKWLTSEENVSEWHCSQREGHRRLADAANWQRDSAPCEMYRNYSLAFLPRHYLGADKKSNAAMLLTDIEYILEKVNNDQTYELVSDYNLIESAWSAVEKEFPQLIEWDKFLNLRSSTIARFPQLLLQQAILEPLNSPVARAAHSMLAEPRWVRPYLRPLRNTNASGITPLKILVGHVEKILCLAFTPDGKKLISGSRDGSSRVWDVRVGKCIAELRGHNGPVVCVAVSEEGNRIVTCSRDETIRWWNLTDGKPLGLIRGYTDYGSFAPVTLSPDGKLVVSSSGSWVWDLEHGVAMRLVKRSHALSAGTRRLLRQRGQSRLRVSRAAEVNTLLQQSSWLSGHVEEILQLRQDRLDKSHYSGSCEAVSSTNDGTLVANARGVDCAIRIWDRHSYQSVKIGGANAGGTEDKLRGRPMSVCSTGRLVLYHRRGCLAIYDIEADEDKDVFDVDASVVTPDWRWAIEFHRNRWALWDLTNRMRVRSVESPALNTMLGLVLVKAISANGHWAAVGDDDGCLCLWDLTNGNVSMYWRVSPDILHYNWRSSRIRPIFNDRAIRGIALSQDGQRVVTANEDGTVTIWDFAQDGAEPRLFVLKGHEGAATCVTMSLCGRKAVSGGKDGKVCVWDLDVIQGVGVLNGHINWVWSVVIFPEETHAASRSRDGTTMIWDLRKMEAIAVCSTNGPIVAGPDGIIICSDDESNQMNLLQLVP